MVAQPEESGSFSLAGKKAEVLPISWKPSFHRPETTRSPHLRKPRSREHNSGQVVGIAYQARRRRATCWRILRHPREELAPRSFSSVAGRGRGCVSPANWSAPVSRPAATGDPGLGNEPPPPGFAVLVRSTLGGRKSPRVANSEWAPERPIENEEVPMRKKKKASDPTGRKLIEMGPPDWVAWLGNPVSDPSRVRAIDSNISTVTAEADKVLWVDRTRALDSAYRTPGGSRRQAGGSGAHVQYPAERSPRGAGANGPGLAQTGRRRAGIDGRAREKVAATDKSTTGSGMM